MRAALMAALVLSLIPQLASSTTVCLRIPGIDDHCEEIPVPGEGEVWVGGIGIFVEIRPRGGIYCTGDDECGTTACPEGLATNWYVFIDPIGDPAPEYRQVDIELPGELCECPAHHLSPCELPDCEVVIGCGEETFGVRIYDEEHYWFYPSFLGVPQVPNLGTTLPMHVVLSSPGPCDIPDPCDPGPPVVQVPIGIPFSAYLLARNYEELSGVQTAFDWGDWVFLFGLWDCQGGQIWGTQPEPPGGPYSGTIATAFDCVFGGQTQVIGRLNFVATTPGCLQQIESSYPFGTHVVTCASTGAIPAPVLPEDRGSICVGAGGIDTCGPASTAVEPTTWGRIKGQYR